MRQGDSQNETLLFIVLSYIFIKGASVSEGKWDDRTSTTPTQYSVLFLEGVLLNFLESLNIDADREHNYFGDVKKKLETFRKQLYLKREKTESESTNEEK